MREPRSSLDGDAFSGDLPAPRPTAFIDDVPVGPLLECLPAPRELRDALRLCSAHAPIDVVGRMMMWLWSRVITAPMDQSC